MIEPQLDAQVITDIRNAVNAGREVTVSKAEITYNGWTGCGYIIVDPVTGAGAYMISGGMNGGWLILLWASQFLLSILLGPLGLVVGPLIAIFGSYLIKTSAGEDVPIITKRQVAGVILDTLVQATMTIGIIALAASGVGAVGLIAFAIMIAVMAVVDWLVFFYAIYLRREPVYIANPGITCRILEA